MTDDFFSKLDADLAKQRVSDKARQGASEQNLKFTLDRIAEMVPLMQGYQIELAQRSITAHTKFHERVVTFRMDYKNGGYRQLSAYPDLPDNLLKFDLEFTGEDGKQYRATDGVKYGQHNWTPTVSDEKLRKCIQDYVFYAPRYGGVS